MKLHFILAGMILAAVCSARADGLYRWVDRAGKVHYSDVPVEGVQAEEVKISIPPAADDADLPYETRRARENFPVTLYVADNCSEPCQKARDFLNMRGIPFTEKNLKSKEEINAFKQMSGGENIPALAIGKSWLIGFLAEQWGSELDFAGYPNNPQVPAKKPVTPLTPLVTPPPDKPATESKHATEIEPATEVGTP